MYTRNTLIWATVVLLFGAGCNETGKPGNDTRTRSITLSAILQDVPPETDSVQLLWEGAGGKEVLGSSKIVRTADSVSLSLTATVPSPGIYVLQFTPYNRVALLLGMDEEVRFRGSILNRQKPLVFEGSEENKRFYTYLNEGGALTRAYARLALAPDEDRRKALADSIWRSQRALHRRLAPGTTVLPVLFALNEVAPYAASGSTESEETYLLKSLFANDSFASPLLGYLPQWYEKCRYFGQILLQSGHSVPEAKRYSEPVLSQLPTGSLQREVFLGAVAGQVQPSRGLFDYFAQQYVTEFPKGRYQAEYAEALARFEGLRLGDPAPEIQLPSPEGKPIALSSLKGKYVLIDFWAAWCTPCRRENPQVVRLYNRYRSKGFEIYGVSLDESKDAWIGAIRSDKLPWIHVSDLKGWQNQAAQRFGVRAIPATVLLNPEGEILAWDLRGKSLEDALAKVFSGVP